MTELNYAAGFFITVERQHAVDPLSIPTATTGIDFILDTAILRPNDPHSTHSAIAMSRLCVSPPTSA